MESGHETIGRPGRSGDVIRHSFGRGLESPPSRPRNKTSGMAVARLASYTFLGSALASTDPRLYSKEPVAEARLSVEC